MTEILAEIKGRVMQPQNSLHVYPRFDDLHKRQLCDLEVDMGYNKRCKNCSSVNFVICFDIKRRAKTTDKNKLDKKSR